MEFLSFGRMTDHHHPTTEVHIPVAEQLVNSQPTKTKLATLIFQWLARILPVRGGLGAPLCRRLWANYYRQVPFGEGAVIMRHNNALYFIINALIAFVEIKSQNVPGFPFKTHPQPIMFSVTSLVIFGLASAAELFVSAAGLDPTSVYAVIAHLGKVASLCILVASLASLFCL